METGFYNYFNFNKQEEQAILESAPEFSTLQDHFKHVGMMAKTMKMTDMEYTLLSCVLLFNAGLSLDMLLYFYNPSNKMKFVGVGGLGGGGSASLYMGVWNWFEWYLLNCSAFCNQTWYGSASSWAGVLCKTIANIKGSKECYLLGQDKTSWSAKTIGLLSSVWRSQWWLMYKIWLSVFWSADPFVTKPTNKGVN